MMTKIDAIRTAMSCSNLPVEVREIFANLTEQYEYNRTHTKEYLRSKDRREKILSIMVPGEEVTARMIAERIFPEAEKDNPLRPTWSDYYMDSQQIGCLLKPLVKSGAVLRRTEDVDLEVFTYETASGKTVITAHKAFYTKV